MPSQPKKMTTVRYPIRRGVVVRFLLAIATSGVVFYSSATPIIVHAQRNAPGPITGITPPPAVEKKARPLEPWRDEVKQRLDQLQKRVDRQTDTEEEQAPPPPKWRVELLPRLDLTLGQLAIARKDASKLSEEQNRQQEALLVFRSASVDSAEATSFMELEQKRDELLAAKRRLAALRNKDTDASSSLEAAIEELKARSSVRRKAKEQIDDGDQQTGPTRRNLHDRAVLDEELADAVFQLRKQEASNAKTELATQQLQVDLLKANVERLEPSTRFRRAELKQLLTDVERQEDALQHAIAEAEAAAPRLKYLEQRWMRAQRQLDESTGEETALREELAAYDLGLRAAQEQLPLLQKRLQRLPGIQVVWQRRQPLFASKPARMRIRDWTDEAEKAISELEREQRNAASDIEKLSSRLGPLESRQKEVPKKSAEANWITQQVASLKRLLENHQANLDSIRDSLQLHKKLHAELNSDSLTATAKDRLLDMWHGVAWLWNYELAVVGDSGVTTKKVVSALLLLVAGIVFSRALSRSLRRQVLRRLDIDAGASATIQSLFYYLLLFLFSLVALKVVKVPLTAFTVLGGAVALGVGFGSQNIINNFISGLILLAERPVKVGDLIKVGDLYGNIEHIGARSTRVRTGANLEIIVPNSSFLQDNVINFTLSNDTVRTFVEVGVMYGSPTVTVTQLLRRAVVETGRVAKDPPPIILFKSFGDSSLVFEVHFWVRMRTMMDQLQVESAVRYRIDQLFRDEGITIAFPQQDVHLDTTEPLVVQMVEQSPSSSAT